MDINNLFKLVPIFYQQLASQEYFIAEFQKFITPYALQKVKVKTFIYNNTKNDFSLNCFWFNQRRVAKQ